MTYSALSRISCDTLVVNWRVLSGKFIMNRGRICPVVNITPVMYALKRTLLISPKSSTSPSDSSGRDSHGRVSAAIVRKCSPCQSS